LGYATSEIQGVVNWQSFEMVDWYVRCGIAQPSQEVAREFAAAYGFLPRHAVVVVAAGSSGAQERDDLNK